jgi:hypothetical protein
MEQDYIYIYIYTYHQAGWREDGPQRKWKHVGQEASTQAPLVSSVFPGSWWGHKEQLLSNEWIDGGMQESLYGGER